MRPLGSALRERLKKTIHGIWHTVILFHQTDIHVRSCFFFHATFPSELRLSSWRFMIHCWAHVDDTFSLFLSCAFFCGGAGRTCLTFVVLFRRMMSTLQWPRPETNVSFQLTCCCSVSLLFLSVARMCCSSQVSFMSLTRCLQSCVTGRTTEPNAVQTERVVTRFVDLMTPDSRLHQSSKKSVSPQHPCIDSVLSCVVFARVARTTLRGSWVYTSRMVAELLVILRSSTAVHHDDHWWVAVNFENEAVQAWQRQSSAEHALATAQQRIQQLSSGDGTSITRTLGKPKSFTGQTSEWTTWQSTFKAFACAAHPKMKEVFDLATRKGSDPVVNSYTTAELQSLCTQLYYMLVMMLSDQALQKAMVQHCIDYNTTSKTPEGRSATLGVQGSVFFWPPLLHDFLWQEIVDWLQAQFLRTSHNTFQVHCFTEKYLFRIHFYYWKLPPSHARKAKCLFHSPDVKISRSALPSGSVVLPLVRTVAARDPRCFMWERVLWLAGKHAGSTLLRLRWRMTESLAPVSAHLDSANDDSEFLWVFVGSVCKIPICKDNTSKDPFSQCEQSQGIHKKVKSEYVGTLTTIDLVTRKQSDKHNNMFNVAANLKHVNTHENNNWRLVSALSLFVCSVSSQLSLFSLSVEWFLVHTLWLKFVPCSSHRHRHVSCTRWVTFSPTSPSTSFSFSSFPLSSCTSCCLSPSSSLMSWTTTTRTAAEELGSQNNSNSSTQSWHKRSWQATTRNTGRPRDVIGISKQ